MRNILTFDVEDWYQGLEIAPSRWQDYPSRLETGMDVILEMLSRHATRATFFVLGIVARAHPALVQRVATAGHEIGTHGWDHTPVYRQTPDAYRTDLRASLTELRAASGQPVQGHRAAFFSITRATPWALGILAEEGIIYDSSIFPVHNYRYGVPDAERYPHRVLPQLTEFPISTLRLGGINVPFSGGFYARFWPYALLRWAIRSLNRQGQPVIAYFHPWEFDPAQPHVGGEVPWLARRTHYYRLASTHRVLAALLRDFRWTVMGEFTPLHGANRSAPV